MIHSRAGFSVMSGLMVMSVVGLLGLGAYELSDLRNKSSKNMKARNFQALVERRTRTRLAERDSFIPTIVPLQTRLNFSIDADGRYRIRNYLADFQLPGSLCESGAADCWMRVSNIEDLPASSQTRITISAIDTAVNISPRQITVDNPVIAVAGALSESCESTPNTPVFAGRDSSGNPICVSLNGSPAALDLVPDTVGRELVSCPPGQALESFSVSNTGINGNCVHLNSNSNPADNPLACPDKHFINKNAWTMGGISGAFELDTGDAANPGVACQPYREIANFLPSTPPDPPPLEPGPGQPPGCRGADPDTWFEWVRVFRDDFDDSSIDWTQYTNNSWRISGPTETRGYLRFNRCHNRNAPSIELPGYDYSQGPYQTGDRGFVWSSKIRVTTRTYHGTATGDGQGVHYWDPCGGRPGVVNWGGPRQRPTTQTRSHTNSGCDTYGGANPKIRMGYSNGSGPIFRNYDGTYMRLYWLEVECYATNEKLNGFDDDCNGVIDDVVPGCLSTPSP